MPLSSCTFGSYQLQLFPLCLEVICTFALTGLISTSTKLSHPYELLITSHSQDFISTPLATLKFSLLQLTRYRKKKTKSRYSLNCFISGGTLSQLGVYNTLSGSNYKVLLTFGDIRNVKLNILNYL